MYKIVIQIPEAECTPLIEPWQETEDPHGPHVKIYRNRVCAETGAPITIVRCKHRTRAEVVSLLDLVLSELDCT